MQFKKTHLHQKKFFQSSKWVKLISSWVYISNQKIIEYCLLSTSFLLACGFFILAIILIYYSVSTLFWLKIVVREAAMEFAWIWIEFIKKNRTSHSVFKAIKLYFISEVRRSCFPDVKNGINNLWCRNKLHYIKWLNLVELLNIDSFELQIFWKLYRFTGDLAITSKPNSIYS